MPPPWAWLITEVSVALDFQELMIIRLPDSASEGPTTGQQIPREPVDLLLNHLRLRCAVLQELTVPASGMPLTIPHAGFLLAVRGNCSLRSNGKPCEILETGEVRFWWRHEGLRDATHLVPVDDSTTPLLTTATHPSPSLPLSAAQVLIGTCHYSEGDVWLSQSHLPYEWAARSSTGSSLISPLLDLATAVAHQRQAGWISLLEQLLTTVALEGLREVIDGLEPRSSGWLSALRDPDIGLVLSTMLERPSDPWTVPTLAGIAHMARSTFARRFLQLTGRAPMDVLLEVRMQLACELLRTTRPLKDVARAVGYGSVSAFAYAFRRWKGTSPQGYRQMRNAELSTTSPASSTPLAD